MINKRLLFILVSAFAAGTLFFASCEDNYYNFDPKEMIQDEQDLLTEFLELKKDSLSSLAIETRDTLYSGLIFFKMKEGEGDSVEVGKNVAYRYTMYSLLRDSMDVPILYYSGSNVDDSEPAEYQAGVTQPYSSVYVGLDEGIRYMKRGEKATLIIPSSLWSSDYVTRVMDVEVTYVER